MGKSELLMFEYGEVFSRSSCCEGDREEEETREEETTRVVKDLAYMESCVGNVSFDSPKVKERLMEHAGIDADGLNL